MIRERPRRYLPSARTLPRPREARQTRHGSGSWNSGASHLGSPFAAGDSALTDTPICAACGPWSRLSPAEASRRPGVRMAAGACGSQGRSRALEGPLWAAIDSGGITAGERPASRPAPTPHTSPPGPRRPSSPSSPANSPAAHSPPATAPRPPPGAPAARPGSRRHRLVSPIAGSAGPNLQQAAGSRAAGGQQGSNAPAAPPPRPALTLKRQHREDRRLPARHRSPTSTRSQTCTRLQMPE
jgi:hypothetical protein